MYGYYLGAELGRATLEGAFAGEQDSVGASVGAYFVTEIQPNLYVDGFASLGLGRNSLELDNGTLNVASDYTTTTGTVGTSLTGVVAGNGAQPPLFATAFIISIAVANTVLAAVRKPCVNAGAKAPLCMRVNIHRRASENLIQNYQGRTHLARYTEKPRRFRTNDGVNGHWGPHKSTTGPICTDSRKLKCACVGDENKDRLLLYYRWEFSW
jgi:hypothetical protein